MFPGCLLSRWHGLFVELRVHEACSQMNVASCCCIMLHLNPSSASNTPSITSNTPSMTPSITNTPSITGNRGRRSFSLQTGGLNERPLPSQHPQQHPQHHQQHPKHHQQALQMGAKLIPSLVYGSGFLRICLFGIMNMVPQGLALFAPDCSSWGIPCRHTSMRSVLNPAGYPGYTFVERGNQMISRLLGLKFGKDMTW